jgi:hypothetical protein
VVAERLATIVAKTIFMLWEDSSVTAAKLAKIVFSLLYERIKGGR